MDAQPSTLTSEVRRRLKTYLESTHCAACGQPNRPASMRRLSRETKVPHSTLVRFMQGEQVYSDTLDVLDVWLSAKEL